MRRKTGIMLAATVVGIVLTGVALYTTRRVPSAHAQIAFPHGYVIGMWDWTAPDKTTVAQKQALASQLKQDGITDVYIDISSFIDYDELPQSGRQDKITAFTTALKQEVNSLSAQGIRAHGLAGNVTWSNPDNAYIPPKILAYVAQYNSSVSAAERLSGMQFDIEFYSDDAFSDNPVQNTTDYLALVKQLVAQRNNAFNKDPNFALGFAIPDWMDGTNAQFMPNVSIDGGPARTPLDAILASLKHAPHSYIAVMSYRNHADGADGTIARAAKEVQRGNASSVRVLVGEETNRVSPAKLSFYGKSRQDVMRSTVDTQQAFGAYGMFAGFAINDAKGYFELSK